MELAADNFLLYIENKQCILFIMHSFFNNWFTVTDNNSTLYKRNRMGSIISKYQLLFFKLTELA